MAKLTKEHIAFIERYLENSGIRYFDVRLEMTDHIATEIEQTDGDFYDNFNAYITRHKKELLASYKKQETESLKAAAKHFFMKAVQPQWLMLFLLLALGVAVMATVAGTATSLNILEYTLMGISAVIGLYFVYSFLWQKKYFMAWTLLSRNYIALIWILWIFRYHNVLNAITPYAALLYYTVLWYLFMVFCIMFLHIRKTLVQRYKKLQLI